VHEVQPLGLDATLSSRVGHWFPAWELSFGRVGAIKPGGGGCHAAVLSGRRRSLVVDSLRLCLAPVVPFKFSGGFFYKVIYFDQTFEG
jgi:hypothetical protein